MHSSKHLSTNRRDPVYEGQVVMLEGQTVALEAAPAPVEQTTIPFLVFGYGSLIWKPPPHVKRRIPGYITTHVRRFWQASEDHRGTVERPGRVVTLVSLEDLDTLGHFAQHKGPPAGAAGQQNKCWGAVYEIVPESVQEVKAYLDIREINGYSLTTVPFYPSRKDSEFGGSFLASVFIGTIDNPQFTPTSDIDAIAAVIHERVGPSGMNKEYLYNLATSLRELNMGEHQVAYAADDSCGDGHIDELVRRVRELDESAP